MFEILIVTHGDMSIGMKDAADVIVGMIDNINVLTLKSGASVEGLGTSIKLFLDDTSKEKDILIMVDLLSASPYNQSLLAVNNLPEKYRDKVHIVTGVNLPMLIEAVNNQILNNKLSACIDSIKEAGKQGIDSWHISALASNNGDFDDDF